MSRKIIACFVTVFLMAAAFSGCGNNADQKGTKTEQKTEQKDSGTEKKEGTETGKKDDLPVTAKSEKRKPLGSPDKTKVRVGLILGPPSMGLGWMMNQAKEGKTFNDFTFEVTAMDYAAVAGKMNEGHYDIINCPSNVGAILYNNKDLKEKPRVIALNNLGILYCITSDPNIKSLEDLKGRTVYSIGEGGPPEYMLDYVLDKKGLLKDVNLSFRPTPFEILNLLQDEKNAVAVVPQPFVALAQDMIPNLHVPVDITKVWHEVTTDGSDCVTTTTLVREDFLKEHEQAVIEYLKLQKESTDYTLKHLKQAAEWSVEFETFLNAEIGEKALPECSIVTITGQEMKDKLSGFLKIMLNYDPDSVGGKLPGDDFYYFPPQE